MLKTVKGKVIAGTVAVTLFAGAGAAFGASDAGANLKTWYDSQFGTAKSNVEAGYQGYAAGKLGALNTEYEGMKSAATASIGETGKSSTTRVDNAIKDERDKYIGQVNDKKAIILADMETQFNKLSTDADGLIDEAGKFAVNYANTQLTPLTEDAGDGAIEQLQEDLKTSRDDAKTALTNAIASAKGELRNELALETTATVKEVNEKIDEKIGKLRIEITKIKNDLVKIQEDRIHAEARTQLNDAKIDLEDIVVDIVKN